MAKLHELVDQVNGKVLWRTSVRGQVVGSQELHEVLGIWYPSHRAFLNLMSAPASEENMRLRKLAVEMAVVPRSDDYTG